MTMNRWAYKWPKPNKQGWLLIILYLLNTKNKTKQKKKKNEVPIHAKDQKRV